MNPLTSPFMVLATWLQDPFDTVLPDPSLPHPGTLIALLAFAIMLPTTLFLLMRSRPQVSSKPRNVPACEPVKAPARPHLGFIESRQQLLNRAEQAFFSVLLTLVRHSCHVSAKVRLAELLTLHSKDGASKAHTQIAGRHVDFLLTDPASSRILCAIKLDDLSQRDRAQSEADERVREWFDSHRLPFLRIPCAWTYYPQALRAELLKAGVELPA